MGSGRFSTNQWIRFFAKRFRAAASHASDAGGSPAARAIGDTRRAMADPFPAGLGTVETDQAIDLLSFPMRPAAFPRASSRTETGRRGGTAAPRNVPTWRRAHPPTWIKSRRDRPLDILARHARARLF